MTHIPSHVCLCSSRDDDSLFVYMFDPTFVHPDRRIEDSFTSVHSRTHLGLVSVHQHFDTEYWEVDKSVCRLGLEVETWLHRVALTQRVDWLMCGCKDPIEQPWVQLHLCHDLEWSSIPSSFRAHMGDILDSACRFVSRDQLDLVDAETETLRENFEKFLCEQALMRNMGEVDVEDAVVFSALTGYSTMSK